MYRFGVEIILYYPDKVALNNVCNYQKIFEYVLVFDNTPIEDINYTIQQKNGTYHLIVGENKGMSVAIESGINWADELGIDYLLTMDQDSDYDEVNVNKVLNHIENNKKKNIAIFASNYRKIMKGAEGYVYSAPRFSIDENKTLNFCMTSGSYMDIKKVRQVLPLDNLFIGFVDNDLCYSLREKGYSLELVSQSVFSQRVGVEIENNILNRVFHKLILSRKRYYLMGRNSRYLINKYKRTKIVSEIKKTRIRILINLIICEEGKVQKIKEWIRGSKEWNTLCKEN